jgi:rhodanese-related sulfurtransferase
MIIQAKQLEQVLQSGKRVALIDVRTPVEHDEMHIAGSRLMPLDRLDPAAVKTAAENAEQCVIICRSGKRAEQAYQKLRAAGCENMVILDGGVMSWESAGLALNRSAKKRLPLMRQVQLVIGVCAFVGSILALTVHKDFALIPAFFCGGLVLAGATGWCGLAVVLSKMPWNKIECGGCKVTSCSV